MRRFVLGVCLVVAAVCAQGAHASPYVRYGIQDDAWLQWGPGTLEQRLAKLDAMGTDVVRFNVDWRTVEPRRGAYDWSTLDPILDGLHQHGIAPLLTLYGTPGWANGGRSENWAPTSGSTFAAFASAVARRYPFVRLWTIWNEPNQRRWLRPTSPRIYTQRLLNPAYAAIHRASPGSQVAGGVTAPRGNTGGVSPLDWVAGMKAAHARLDAYAHNPYPLAPHETPVAGGCGHCTTVTLSTIGRLLAAVRKDFGAGTRVWLTEYGYQTNPPDRLLGVSYSAQARYLAEAALRAYELPRVDLLVHYLVADEPDTARWQSGLFTTRDIPKPAYQAFRFPLAERSRTGRRTVLWGQVRPGSGPQRYRLLRFADGDWHSVGGTATTSPRGYLTRVVDAAPGARFRLWVPAERTYSAILTVD
ncbi:MAG TPA: beta-galactosidase [Gaiellaceae bacterium]|nr:beta-galactosidase [Gaiellaceae bacterium]